MHWIARSERPPPEGIRVLAFSPEYPEGHPMRFRTLDSQFYKLSLDSTHWAALEAPE
jgi:hypothetical protein